MSRTGQKEERVAMIAFATGANYQQETLATCLRSISEAVVSIHYSGYDCREELVSIGIEKAISLLKADYFDPAKNIRGFLYTGIRNEVGNYLRRESRTTSVTPDSDCFGATMGDTPDCLWGVEYEKHHNKIQDRLRVCGVMDDRYNDTTRGAALYRAIL